MSPLDISILAGLLIPGLLFYYAYSHYLQSGTSSPLTARKERAAFLKEIAAVLQAKKRRDPGFWTLRQPAEFTLQGTYTGLPCECRLAEESLYDHGRLKIRLLCPFPETLEIRPFISAEAPQGGGTVNELSNGWECVGGTEDPDIDGKFLIRCENQAFSSRFLTGEKSRQLIKELFYFDLEGPLYPSLYPFTFLSLNPGSVEITITGKITKRITVERFKAILDRLCEIWQRGSKM